MHIIAHEFVWNRVSVFKYTQAIYSLSLALRGEMNGMNNEEVYKAKGKKGQLQNKWSKMWRKVELFKKKSPVRHESKTISLIFRQQFKQLFFQPWPLEKLGPQSDITWIWSIFQKLANNEQLRLQFPLSPYISTDVIIFKHKSLGVAACLLGSCHCTWGKLLFGMNVWKPTMRVQIHPKQQHLKYDLAT